MRIVYWLLGLLLLTQPHGQLQAAPLQHPPYLPPKVLNVAKGLSQNTVTALLRDREGFLWIATQDGLNRYDGQRLQIFHASSADPHSLSAEHITALGEDSQGRLWIGGADGSLVYRQHGRFQAVQVPWQPSPINTISTLDNDLVVANKAGLWRFANSRWQLLLPVPIRSVVRQQHAIWVLDNSGQLWRFDQNGADKILQQPQALVMSAGPDGSLWLAGNGTLWRLANDNLISTMHWPATPHHRPVGLKSDHQGRFYLITLKGSLYLLTPDNKQLMDLAQGPLQDLISAPRCLLVDADQQLWLGTTASGVLKLPSRHHAIRYFVDPAGKRYNNIRAIFKDGDQLWLGTAEHGPSLLTKNGHYRHFQKPLASLLGMNKAHFSLMVNAITRGPDNALWMATDHGVIRRDPQGQWQQFAGGLSDQTVWDIRFVNQQLWAATRAGVYLLSAQHQFERQGPAVASFVLALRGQQLLAGYEDTLCQLLPRFSCWPAGRFRHRVRSLLDDGHNGWWIGTQSGFLHLNAQGQFQRWEQQAGLEDDTIYAIARGNHHLLWLSTNRGLVTFDTQSKRFRAMSSSDFNLEYNGNAQWHDQDGTLYFGGVSGLAEVGPDFELPGASHYGLQWVDALLNGKALTLVAGQPLQLPSPLGRLSLRFADLDLRHQNQRYEYQINGTRQALGEQRQITLTHLSPGAHLLQVWRLGQDSSVLRYQLQVMPPWYLHPRYVLIELALLLLLIAGVWWLRWQILARRRAMQQQLAENEQRLRLALVASGYGVWDWDWEHHRVLRTGLDFLGYQPGQINETPAGLAALVHPDDKNRITRAVRRHIKGKDKIYQCRYRLRHAQGHWVWIQDRGSVVQRGENQQILRMTGTHIDISADMNRERQLQLSELVTQAMSEGVLVTDSHFDIISANPAVEKQLATSRLRLHQCRLWDFLPRDQRRYRFSQLRQAIAAEGTWAGELAIRDGSDRERLLEVELHWAHDAQQGANLVVLFNDITERKAAEEELRYLANFDPLTGLPNRALFHDRLGHAIARAKRGGHMVALLFLDLDHFKNINDSLGHHLGDKLLKEVAQRLTKATRSYDTVARLGGDEFTVVLEDLRDTLNVTLVAEKIMQSMEPAMTLAGHQVSIGASIGIALYPQDSDDQNTLLRYADTAMYHAKSRGRATFQYYTEAMNAAVQRRLTLESGLRQALAQGELHLVYQPRIDLASGQMQGVEALARWTHPTLGPVSPADFIPLAEETGLIHALGDWVLTEAIAQQQRLQSQGIDLQMAVNLSARQFQQLDLPGRVSRLLSEADMSQPRLELELTESALLSARDDAARQILRLRQLGIKLALDDFGTGYSSLSYLTELRFDIIKIDRSFVAKIPTDKDSVAVIRSVVGLAHALGMRIVAEGIETDEQRQSLLGLGCDEGQGYYFARPMSGEELLHWRP
ncbi:EAL domain-containing protein [Gallaecimonas sp. GXIMD1310]|uniref:EAL domain-containing protein n=1 Tax=Gallaecimonas sp. GXIMD1310 TaxID=3131926 RepID=UPI0032517D1F